MNQIILCAFYIENYCNNCVEKSEDICSKCRQARQFLESDDKKQNSVDRLYRNYIVNIDLSYAEDKNMILNKPKNTVEKLIDVNNSEKIRQAFSTLTETQKRRFIAHCVDGRTYRDIGHEEGVTHTKIKKSVDLAKKKIKNFLK